MRGFMRGFDNRIIAHAVRCCMSLRLQTVSLFLARLKLLVYFKYSFYCGAKFYAATTLFRSNGAGGSRFIDVDSVGCRSLCQQGVFGMLL